MHFVNYEVYNNNIQEREIIDFACKGNIIRFYLGKNGTQWGDDWDDPFDNAGTVYMEYVGATVDLYLPFSYMVLSPQDVSYNYYSSYSKEQMLHRCFPCVVLLPDTTIEHFYDLTFDKCQGHADAIKFYCGDKLDPECIKATVIDTPTIKKYANIVSTDDTQEIIDFAIKGNLIHFYLGKNGKQSGNSWDHTNYKEYASVVDDKYVVNTVDVYIPFDDMILEPNDGCRYNCKYSKNDMKEKKIPCLIQVPAKTYCDEYCCNDFQHYLDNPEVSKYYFGDPI